jgi:hypothetical protein
MKKPCALLLCLLFSAPFISLAQEKVDLPMIGRIKAEGFANSQVMDIAGFLTDVHGPRLTGSPNLKAASEWARDKLTEWGLVNSRLESWGVFGRGWAVEKFSFDMIEPQYAPLIAYPEAWTPGTNGAITGSAVYAKIESEADLEKYKGKLKGVFVLTRPPTLQKLNTEADAKRFDEKQLANLAMAPELVEDADDGQRDERARSRDLQEKIGNLLKQEGAAVWIKPSRDHDYGTFDVMRGGSQNIGAEPAMPAVAMASEHYARLVRLIEKGIPVTLSIHIQNQFYEADSLGYNVIAEISGADKKLKDEVVMLGGHLDSWHGGTGATDNAAGCAVAMEALRVLKALNFQPRRTIRIALWSGEEQGLLGSRGYVKKHFGDRHTMQLTSEHEKFSVYFNMDNGTGKFRGIYLQENEAARPIFEAWFKPFHDLGAAIVTIRNTGGTDHLSFNEVGLPGFQFIQDPVEYGSRTHHSNMDIYDHLEKGDLMQASVIMASFVYHAAMRDEKFPRKELPKPQPLRTTLQ